MFRAKRRLRFGVIDSAASSTAKRFVTRTFFQRSRRLPVRSLSVTKRTATTERSSTGNGAPFTLQHRLMQPRSVQPGSAHSGDACRSDVGRRWRVGGDCRSGHHARLTRMQAVPYPALTGRSPHKGLFAADVLFQVLDQVFLGADDVLDQVTDGQQADQLSVIHDRKVAQAITGH